MDTGPVPQQLGAVQVLATGPEFDLPAVEHLIAERIRAVPRLRQRLVRVPPGCGRPVWVDDPGFDAAQHVRRVPCPAPGDEQALLDVAAAVVTDPLPSSRPLWSAVLVTGLADDTVGLVFVLHHVLADGIGGLAVLACRVDPPVPPARAFPQPPPSRARLAADAFTARLRALSRLPAAVILLRRSLVAAGGLRAPRAARCSILRPTGPRRRFAPARADLADLRAAAHRFGGTVNDAVLTAVTGALHTLLEHRGEAVDTFGVAVLVAARRMASVGELGNEVAPLLVGLPGGGDPAARLRRIAATVRAARSVATGPPAIALLGPVFPALAVLRFYHLYLNHQRRFHTLVSDVRGPDRRLTLAGGTVGAIVPLSVAEAGNVTVGFVALSYAGTLTITVVADPDHVPDLPVLASALQAELDTLTGAPQAPGRPGA